MRINELLNESVSSQVLYHGSSYPITQFKIPPYGLFFSPHKEWAQHYGDVVTPVKINAKNIHVLSDSSRFDRHVLDAIFDRDYTHLAEYIKVYQLDGVQALQTETDSEMVIVFPGTEIKIIAQ